MAQLIRDSLDSKIDEFEIRLREEERERQEKKKQFMPYRTPVEFPVEPPVDRLAPVFQQYAVKIARTLHNPVERTRAEQEAFAAIKRIAPISYSNNDKIIARLDMLVSEMLGDVTLPPTTPLQESQPQLPVRETLSSLLGSIFDPLKENK